MKSLALTGGGCLGIGQILALQKLEQSYGIPIYKLVDIISGTSVGSINGTCLSIGVLPSQILDFYRIDAPKIFSSTFFNALILKRLFKSAKYKPDQLETSLKNILGDSTLADCKTKFIAMSIDMKTGKNVYFQSYGKSYEDFDEIIIGPDSGIKLWEVARASSAAQSYFPAYVWNNRVFWDGGETGANSPDMVLYTECLGWDNNIKMLSMTCGYADWPYVNDDMINPPLTKVAEATLALGLKGPQKMAIWQAQKILKHNHTLLHPYLGQDFDMDDASPDTQSKELAIWQKLLDDNPNIFSTFI